MKKIIALVMAVASFLGMTSTLAAQCNYKMDIRSKAKSATQVELQKEVRNELAKQGLIDRDLV